MINNTTFFKHVIALKLAFWSSLVIMSYELVAARLIAPLLGDSLYTWTAIIGMVLAGMTLGTWLGGRASDRHHDILLPFSYGLGALSIAVIPLLYPLLQNMIIASDLSLPLLSLIVAAILTFIPTTTLTFAHPIFITKITSELSHLGSRYSFLSIAGSIGSIVGVFIGGFYMIPFLGTHVSILIFVIVISIMGLSSLLLINKRNYILPLIMILVIICISIAIFITSTPKTSARLIHTEETPYYHIHIYDAPFQGKDGRWLFLDFDSHSIDTFGEMTGMYTDTAFLIPHLISDQSRVAVLGAGAYTIPKIISSATPDAHIDVIEIDSALEHIGYEYFDLGQHPSIKTQIGDPRILLPKSKEKYDLIFNDVYNSFISVPAHLVSKEFFEITHNQLHDDGIYMMSFIASNEGDGARIAHHMTATAQSVFEDVHVLFLGGRDETISSYVLFMSPNTETLSRDKIEKLLDEHTPLLSRSRIVTENFDTVRPFTDTWQPIESMMRPLMKTYFQDYKDVYYSIVQ